MEAETRLPPHSPPRPAMIGHAYLPNQDGWMDRSCVSAKVPFHANSLQLAQSGAVHSIRRNIQVFVSLLTSASIFDRCNIRAHRYLPREAAPTLLSCTNGPLPHPPTLGEGIRRTRAPVWRRNSLFRNPKSSLAVTRLVCLCDHQASIEEADCGIGKTLGAGSYSVVKECVHIDTGRYYAAKGEDLLRAGREPES
jgi:hypothetical protein